MKSLEEREERERHRHEVIEKAVSTADRIILGGSDGSVEETNYLTAEVAARFVKKTCISISSALFRKDLED